MKAQKQETGTWTPSTATKSGLKDKIKSMEGYPLIGRVIYWSIHDFRRDYVGLLSDLTGIGLPHDVAPRVRDKSALQRALKAQQRGQKNSRYHKVVDDKDRAAFTLGNEIRDAETIDVQYQTVTRAVMTKHGGLNTVKVEGPGSDAIEQSYQDFRNVYTTDQFRDMVLRIIEKHADGVSIREKGGVYFIPAHKDDVFQKIVELFAMYPQMASLEIVPVIDTAEAKKSMHKALTADVANEIARLKEDLENLPNDATEARLRDRLEKYQALRDKVEHYEILLTANADDLKSDLAKLTSVLNRKLVQD